MDLSEHKPRLGIEDKRHLFQSLLAMVERLFYLNKFPVDQEDFALSLQPAEIEAAWRLLQKDNNKSLSPNAGQYFTRDAVSQVWNLHLYPESTEDNIYVFMDTGKHDIDVARRHQNVVNNWCTKQARLEDQMLRSIKVIKAIVHSCNTVGQYKRVSPDLLGFLPAKYRDALGAYTKKSPYPGMGAEPHEIDTTLSTLAYAALQPVHTSEENYTSKAYYHHRWYSLESFPRSRSYDRNNVRQLEL